MKTRISAFLLVVCCNVYTVYSQVEWKTKANKLIPGQCKAVTYKGKIYVSSLNAAGNFLIEEFNPATNTWMLKKGVSHSKNAGEYCMAATEAGVFILGGYWNNTPSKTMEKYDTEKDTFILMNDMPVGLDCATAASVNNTIYLMGGSPGNTNLASNKVYAYDAVNGQWSQKQFSPNGRREAQAEVIKGKIYLFGGFAQSGPKNTVDVYDPLTDSWVENKNSIMRNDQLLIGMGAANDELYFIGGTFSNNGVTSAELFNYRPATNTVIKIANRSDLTWLMGRVSLNDSIYFIGGIKGEFPNGPKQNATYLLSPKVSTSAFLPSYDDELHCRYDPATRNINITITGETNEDCLVSVYHLSGTKLITESIRKGTMETFIPMTSCSNGWYIVAANEKGKRRNSMVAVY